MTDDAGQQSPAEAETAQTSSVTPVISLKDRFAFCPHA